MEEKNYELIGTMSGTSCDGLDIAYCRFWKKKKKWFFKVKNTSFEHFDNRLKKKLLKCYDLSSYKLKKLDIELGDFISKKICDFISKYSLKPMLIASHGHTVFHNPSDRITLQIGNALVINTRTKIKVINNFRELDVLNGGQGAPLVAYGDLKLFSEYDYCINIGGIVNISKLNMKKLIAYDICPSNIILNKFSRLEGFEYDKNGNIASKGNIIPHIFDKLNEIEYYRKSEPKSLDINYIEKNFFPLLQNYPNKDILNTVVNHIAYQINKNIEGKNQNILLSGGGTFNKYLIKKIQLYNTKNHNFIKPNNDIISFKEAIIFGYLGLLKFLDLKNINNSVTGSRNSSSSGTLVENRLF